MSLLASKSTVTLPNTPGPLVTVRLIAVPLVSGSETMVPSEDWEGRRRGGKRERIEGERIKGERDRERIEGWDGGREGRRER